MVVVVLVFDLLAGGEKGIRSSRSDFVLSLWLRDVCVLEQEHEHEHEQEQEQEHEHESAD